MRDTTREMDADSNVMNIKLWNVARL